MIAGLSYVFSQLVNVHSMVFLHHLILKEAFTSVQKENSKLQSLHLVVLLSLALVTNGQQTSDRALQPPIFPCPNVGTSQRITKAPIASAPIFGARHHHWSFRNCRGRCSWIQLDCMQLHRMLRLYPIGTPSRLKKVVGARLGVCIYMERTDG